MAGVWHVADPGISALRDGVEGAVAHTGVRTDGPDAAVHATIRRR
jgi:hypothetical protein